MKCKKCGLGSLGIIGNQYKVNPITGELYTEKVYICNNDKCKNLYKEEGSSYSSYY